jgi:hypothetical protein
MLYSPLQPTEELAVELAVSEWREWHPKTFEELFVFDNDRREKETEDGASGVAVFDTAPSLQSTRRMRVWIPSRTQLSFQFLWWGYRMQVFSISCLSTVDCHAATYLLPFWPSSITSDWKPPNVLQSSPLLSNGS